MAQMSDPWHDRGANGVWLGDRKLDVTAWRLDPPAAPPAAGAPMATARQTIARAAELAGPQGLRHLVIGVIGPREATATQLERATEIGRQLARLSVTVLCGGRSGVMEAVCAGVAEEGGLSLGFLPGMTPDEANPHVGIALPTGLSEGRNMLIARSARVLIAIGGSYGTLTEIAFGLHFGKRVIGLDTAPDIDGMIRAESIDAALEHACDSLLAVTAGNRNEHA